jgi:FkbM family methyltransferase
LICVEPNPYLFEALRSNMRTNGIGNVDLVNKAVGADAGHLRFDLIKEIGPIGGKGLRLVERPWLREEFIQTVDAETTTLDELFRISGVSRAGILKIDVEGMELDVLAGATACLDAVDKIVIERHSRTLRDEVVHALTARGFTLLYEEDPEFKQYYGDLYFVNKDADRRARGLDEGKYGL